MTDFYQRGMDLGDSYLAGQDIAAKRRKQQTDDDYTQAQTARVRGITQGEEADRASTEQLRQGLGNAYGTTPPGGGLAAPALSAPPSGAAPIATGMADPGAAAPAATPSGNTPGGYQFGRGEQMRKLAAVYGRAGKSEQADKYMTQADQFDKADVYNHGAAVADDPKKLDTALRMVNQKDPSLTVAKGKDGMYHMTMVSPDGQAHIQDLSGADLRHLTGAQALMEAGFVQDALPLFAQVDARLAATIATRNSANKELGTFDNKATIDSRNSDAKATLADAAMARAQAAQMRAEATASKAPKEIPPELNAAHNDLVEKLGNETDPKKRKQLITQINANETKIANALGKPRGLPAEREAKPVSEADIQSYIDSRSAQDKAFKATSFDNKREAAKAALSGLDTGGVAAVDVSTPMPAPSAGGLKAPAGPSLQDQARASLSKTPIGGLVATQPATEEEALAAKTGFNPYLQPKTK